MGATGLPDGTVYPALRRLEAAGMMVSDWEPFEKARREKRPPRRYYRLTAEGHQMLTAAKAKFRGLEHVLGQRPFAQSLAKLLENGFEQRSLAIRVALGLVLALAFGRTLETLMFEFQPGDPRILLAVLGVLSVVAAVATIVPAWRAGRADPSVALRSE